MNLGVLAIVGVILLSGCAKEKNKPTPLTAGTSVTKGWRILGHGVASFNDAFDPLHSSLNISKVDCKDESTQVNIYLTNRTIVTDCYAVVGGLEKLFAKSTESSKPPVKKKAKPKCYGGCQAKVCVNCWPTTETSPTKEVLCQHGEGWSGCKDEEPKP